MTRSCGGCTLCCKLIPVEEIAKPAGHRCQHQRHARGCMIYAVRPLSCREWNCMWLVGEEDGKPLDLSRPDNAHYVIDMVPDIIRATDNETGEVVEILVLQVWVDPKFPDAWQDKGLLDLLERQDIVALVRLDSEHGFTLFPPGRNASGQWKRVEAINNDQMRGAQRQARFDFWSRQAAATKLMGGEQFRDHVSGGDSGPVEDW